MAATVDATAQDFEALAGSPGKIIIVIFIIKHFLLTLIPGRHLRFKFVVINLIYYI
jgi:hypothetical protein